MTAPIRTLTHQILFTDEITNIKTTHQRKVNSYIEDADISLLQPHSCFLRTFAVRIAVENSQLELPDMYFLYFVLCAGS